MWTQPENPNADSFYDHVMCDTPLGLAKIEWKSWKKHDRYSLTVGDKYICDYDSIDEAKTALAIYLTALYNAINIFISEYYNGI